MPKPNEATRDLVGVWYPDDLTHVSAMETLRYSGLSYAAILHDRDVYASGENVGQRKKAHWHVVISFRNPRNKASVAKSLGIEENYLEYSHSRVQAERYLVHADDPDKYQYHVDDVFGSLREEVVRVCSPKLDEASLVLDIVAYLDSQDGLVTYKQLLVWACQNGYYGAFRRLGYGVKELIYEHNSVFAGKVEMEKVLGHNASVPFDARCAVLDKAGFPAKELEG